MGDAGGPAGAPPGPRALALALERRATENLEARVRHAGAPERFMESELDLDEAVRAVAGLGGHPELFPEFVALGAVPTLVGLVGHDNASLAADVVDVVRELTDAEALGEHPSEARSLAESLLAAGLLEALAERLGKLDEGVSEEAVAVFNTLSVFENLLEVVPEGAGERLVGDAGALGWLLHRAAAPTHDSNRLAAAELLAVLLHRGGRARAALVASDGVELLLQSAARYRRREPEPGEEEEYVEDVFAALRSAVAGGDASTAGAPGPSDAVGRAFLEAEGLELLVLLLRRKCFARHCALKVLEAALEGGVPGAPERFVRAGGLGALFAAFMGRGLSRRARREEGGAEFSERVVAVLAGLLAGLPRGPERDRVYAKFREAELEKVDRLVELWGRYFDALERQDPAEAAGDDPEDAYIHRLDGGLHTLQQLSFLAGNLWGMGDPQVQHRLLFVLHQQGLSLTLVAEVLAEQLEFDGARAGPEEPAAARSARERRAVRLESLIKALRVPDSAAAAGRG